jgi:hypothetical protein
MASGQMVRAVRQALGAGVGVGERRAAFKLASHRLRQHRLQLGERVLGGGGQRRIADRHGFSEAERQGVDLGRCEHQRRQCAVAGQRMAEARLAFDADA